MTAGDHSSERATVAGGRLTVDLDALAANYALLAGEAAPTDCAAVVKANGYGLGMAAVAPRLARAGCGIFFVATLAEGLALRELLPEENIYVLEGPWPGQHQAYLGARLRPVINTVEQFDQWATLPGAGPCALHVDTGMSRLGLTPADARALAARGLAGLQVDYLLTHLACTDEPDHAATATQIALFDEMRALFPGLRTSLGNTAGVGAGELPRGDLVRAGIGLYGGNPRQVKPNPFRAVATLEGRVLQVREVDPGTPVGYGATFHARGAARLATLGVGYADGYPRSLGNCGYGVVAGRRVPVVGRVSMDSIVVDITSLPGKAVNAGDFIQLLGAEANIDEVAALGGTISYEILTRLGPRLERRYVGQP